ncbi:MAG: rhodanese-like domain-containing protein [Candidatus Korobacteraceae bacterium]
MLFALISIICVVLACVLIAIRIKKTRERLNLERHSISPEDLHELRTSHQDLYLVDVRLPLDLLADSEIIPGAIRIDPNEVLQNPSLIPTDREVVVYCTCPGDETSRRVLTRALAMHLSRIKLLKGGLAGWKARGYSVVPYEKSFHLDVLDTPRKRTH